MVRCMYIGMTVFQIIFCRVQLSEDIVEVLGSGKDWKKYEITVLKNAI